MNLLDNITDTQREAINVLATGVKEAKATEQHILEVLYEKKAALKKARRAARPDANHLAEVALGSNAEPYPNHDTGLVDAIGDRLGATVAGLEVKHKEAQAASAEARGAFRTAVLDAIRACIAEYEAVYDVQAKALIEVWEQLRIGTAILRGGGIRVPHSSAKELAIPGHEINVRKPPEAATAFRELLTDEQQAMFNGNYSAPSSKGGASTPPAKNPVRRHNHEIVNERLGSVG